MSGFFNGEKGMDYIIFGSSMYCYEIAEHDPATDEARITIYLNPDDVRARKPLRNESVSSWSSYLSAK